MVLKSILTYCRVGFFIKKVFLIINELRLIRFKFVPITQTAYKKENSDILCQSFKWNQNKQPLKKNKMEFKIRIGFQIRLKILG
jgi:hypothetical protein